MKTKVKPYEKHFFSIITQNDSYFNAYIDRYYTAGHGLLYSSKEGDYGFLNKIGFIDGVTSWSLVLNQSIYAPKDRMNPNPRRDSHPYAGYLNLGFLWHHRGENVLENLGIRLGMTGKASLAQEVQDFVHGALGTVILPGWGTQLKNEFIFNLHYDVTYRFPLVDFGAFSLDALPYIEAALGNANIYLRGGAVLRIGHHLKSTFLLQGIAGENGGSNSGRVFEDGIGYYLFVGGYGGYVGRNMFIEGNSFGERRAVLKKWMGGIVAGIAIVSGVMSFSYEALYISKEFRGQDRAHGIGSFVFSWSF
ncbi:lipid A deacylase LpxR family protein [Helicobacter pametensis]|uniref:lipid A deacylase LpxR family protein n=1 Tax=Helicobacter pametensis TaxID=95149 RepID=UPI0013158DFE|nr:lipid A deacylase LpxR family protein [Helicobacter pametensis]